jgi:hypothetical protein
MLTALLLNERPRAPFLMTGPVKDRRSGIRGHRGRHPAGQRAAKKLHVRDHLKTIVHRDTGAKLKILTFDPTSLPVRRWSER